MRAGKQDPPVVYTASVVEGFSRRSLFAHQPMLATPHTPIWPGTLQLVATTGCTRGS
jgi:hypothetical protein